MKALVGTFNKEKALVGAFSVIAKTSWIFVSNSSQGPVRVGGAAPQQPPALPEAERGREAERPRGGEAVREQRGGAEGEPDKLIQ